VGSRPPTAAIANIWCRRRWGEAVINSEHCRNVGLNIMIPAPGRVKWYYARGDWITLNQ